MDIPSVRVRLASVTWAVPLRLKSWLTLLPLIVSRLAPRPLIVRLLLSAPAGGC